MKKAIIHTDGGARGNPGPAAIGVTLKIQNQTSSYGEYIGETTNNQAEYRAVLFALQKAHALGVTHIECFLDSELVVQQLNHKYKVKDSELGKLFVQIWNISQKFSQITFTHIPRSLNAQADRLVNKVLDEESYKKSP